MPGPTIRLLEATDFDGWNALFQGYLDFYRQELSEETTKTTFSRLVDGSGPLFGLLALPPEGGRPVGLANCLLHHTTWSREMTCYLEDLYVSEEARGSGAARALIEAAMQEAARRGCDRIYWHTQAFNGRARSLYDQVADLSSMVVYERSLGIPLGPNENP